MLVLPPSCSTPDTAPCLLHSSCTETHVLPHLLLYAHTPSPLVGDQCPICGLKGGVKGTTRALDDHSNTYIGLHVVDPTLGSGRYKYGEYQDVCNVWPPSPDPRSPVVYNPWPRLIHTAYLHLLSAATVCLLLVAMNVQSHVFTDANGESTTCEISDQ